MRESVEITMLGKFTIFGPGMAAPKAVSLTGRARRLWILTAYLILNRERGVSARELIDLLWPDSESSDPIANPAKQHQPRQKRSGGAGAAGREEADLQPLRHLLLGPGYGDNAGL